MNCKICNNNSSYIFSKKILEKYDTRYFKCENCGFLQIENPHWLNEAYEDAISSLDTGLVSRNLYFSTLTEKLILGYFDSNKKFIDYGGGYGLFVRLMRDKGFDFYRQDKYCQNLFAQYFDVTDLSENIRKFELLTAFELFEHLENPIGEVENMLVFSDSILFSTELQPDNVKNYEDWWYLTPETGQHISFYTKKSLKIISKKFGLNLYTDGVSLHLLTKKHLGRSPFQLNRYNISLKIQRKLAAILSSAIKRKNNKSLTQKDNQYIKAKLKHD